jgi:hypothetical protein
MKNHLQQYQIQGTTNLDENPCFSNKDTYPQFQDELASFKSLLLDLTNAKECKTFYKFGDGDYFFLRKENVGSAEPGRRALSVPYHALEKHNEFVEGTLKNDFINVEIYPENRGHFHTIYPNRKIDFPAEFGYGLVANKWLFQNFAGKIGLIGAYEKMVLIHSLMSHPEYREFLGIESFNEYICIPQKFACDNIDLVEQHVAKQLAVSPGETQIYLVGIGHVKSALMHRFKKYKNAIFLDVGSGIDAIAGIVDFARPYMGDWTNYRLKAFDYSIIDFLQYTPVPEKEVWL